MVKVQKAGLFARAERQPAATTSKKGVRSPPTMAASGADAGNRLHLGCRAKQCSARFGTRSKNVARLRRRSLPRNKPIDTLGCDGDRLDSGPTPQNRKRSSTRSVARSTKIGGSMKAAITSDEIRNHRCVWVIWPACLRASNLALPAHRSFGNADSISQPPSRDRWLGKVMCGTGGHCLSPAYRRTGGGLMPTRRSAIGESDTDNTGGEAGSIHLY